MLEDLMNIRGVRGAALVDAGGKVLSSAGGELDASVVTAGRAVAGSLVSAIGSGELKDMIIDFESGPVLLTTLGERTLMTAFDDVANLGRVRFGLKKVLPKLSA
jgi:predicted regulator of Ras-like GTPase activity (Roadblock/LC7/MglB family)